MKKHIKKTGKVLIIFLRTIYCLILMLSMIFEIILYCSINHSPLSFATWQEDVKKIITKYFKKVLSRKVMKHVV